MHEKFDKIYEILTKIENWNVETLSKNELCIEMNETISVKLAELVFNLSEKIPHARGKVKMKVMFVIILLAKDIFLLTAATFNSIQIVDLIKNLGRRWKITNLNEKANITFICPTTLPKRRAYRLATPGS